MKPFKVDNLDFDCEGYKQTENLLIVHNVQEDHVVSHLMKTAQSGKHVSLVSGENSDECTVKRSSCSSFIFRKVNTQK